MVINSKEYKNVHSWVLRVLGRPKKECTINADHKSGQYSWANISREYRRDVTDWITLCASCHKLFDLRKFTVDQLKSVFQERERILASL